MKKILLGMMAAILVLTMAAGALAEEAGLWARMYARRQRDAPLCGR